MLKERIEGWLGKSGPWVAFLLFLGILALKIRLSYTAKRLAQVSAQAQSLQREIKRSEQDATLKASDKEITNVQNRIDDRQKDLDALLKEYDRLNGEARASRGIIDRAESKSRRGS